MMETPMGKAGLCFTLLGLFSACIFTQSLLAGSSSQDAKLLASLDEQWSAAAGARDLDKVVSFYAGDAAVYPPNEPAATNPADIRAVWARYFAAPGFQISWKTTASGAENKTGWTSGTYQYSFTGPAGKPVVEKGKYLCVWQKGADGKWHAIRDIWNSDSK
jgi:ketosteroid isomerase-like protein